MQGRYKMPRVVTFVLLLNVAVMLFMVDAVRDLIQKPAAVIEGAVTIRGPGALMKNCDINVADNTCGPVAGVVLDDYATLIDCNILLMTDANSNVTGVLMGDPNDEQLEGQDQELAEQIVRISL